MAEDYESCNRLRRRAMPRRFFARTPVCCRPGSRPVRSTASEMFSAAERRWKSKLGSDGWPVWNQSVRGGRLCRPPMKIRCGPGLSAGSWLALSPGCPLTCVPSPGSLQLPASHGQLSWQSPLTRPSLAGAWTEDPSAGWASRRVSYLKDDAGKVTRVEPWSIVFTDLGGCLSGLEIPEAAEAPGAVVHSNATTRLNTCRHAKSVRAGFTCRGRVLESRT